MTTCSVQTTGFGLPVAAKALRARIPTTLAANATGALRTDWFHYDALGNRGGGNDMASRGPMLFVRRNNNRLNQYESWQNS